jgi:hypothetical protein
MVRKGKQLEETVAFLHKMLEDRPCKIETPDLIEDKITGQKREVDISIKTEVSSIPLTIIVECRDRKYKQDVTWIEQVVTKCRNLNANKVIAVSANDFTQPAKEMAKHYGIETRVLKNITHDDVKSWFAFDYVELEIDRFNIVGLEVKLVNGKINEFPLNTNDEIFVVDTEKISLSKLFRREIMCKQDIFIDVPFDGTKIIKQFEINDTEQKYKLEIPEEETYQLDKLILKVKLYRDLKNISISDIVRYKDENKTIIERISFPTVKIGDGEFNFGFIRKENKET